MKRFWLLVLLSLGLASCDAQKGKDTLPLTFSVSEIKLPADGGPVSFIVHTKGGTWTAKATEDWLSIEPESGSGTVDVAVKGSPNYDDETREAYIEFSMPEAFSGVMSLPVTQAGGAENPGQGGDKPDGQATAVVSTGAVSGLGKSQATLSGSFSGATGVISDRGFYWGTSESTLTNQLGLNSAEGSEGCFSGNLSNLTPGTVYYYKAYVTEFDAESQKYVDRFGSVLSFETLPDGGTPPSQLGGLQYLGGYEIPAIDLIDREKCNDSGQEKYGQTKWFNYKTTNEDRMVVTHTYKYNGKVYRNYTCLVDKTKKAPLWSAFVMHSEAYPDNNIGGRLGSFSSNWDPGIPSNWQQESSQDGYSRGHLVASDYRQVVADANKETFYATNQALQQQNQFNGGVWEKLEKKVKGTAPSGTDTLYVVVGLLYESDVPVTYHGQVPCPSHFYKLLMKCSFDSGTGEMSSAKGCAYLFTNVAHWNGNKPESEYDKAEFLTTIDAIEERSGFDFFTNVPKKFQDNAENCKIPIW